MHACVLFESSLATGTVSDGAVVATGVGGVAILQIKIPNNFIKDLANVRKPGHL